MNETIGIRGAKIAITTASPRMTLVDHVLPAGFAGPPLHVHPGFDEVLLVREGTLSLRVEGEVTDIGPGQSAYIAGDRPHTFANTADEPVDFVAAMAPGGFEEYLRCVAAADEEGAARIAARFGFAPWPGD